MSTSEERAATSAASATPLERANALLREMTIEEKAMQLSALYPMGLLGPEGPIHDQLDAQLGHGIGHVCGLGLLGHKTPETVAKRSTPSRATWSKRPDSASRRSSTTRR